MCLAIPGRLMEIEGEDSLTRSGKVDFGGILKVVNLAYVPEVRVGDYVIVHAGFAISTLDEQEARRVFDYLQQIEELGDLEDEQEELSHA